MITETECRELIMNRLGELIPTATASTLPKLASTLFEMNKGDHLKDIMQVCMKPLDDLKKEIENAHVQEPSV